MPDGRKSGSEERPDSKSEELSIASPRLTPQRRTDPVGGQDSTNPMGEGAKQGQSDKAEG